MITTRATNVITKAEEKLSSHSIEPPPENKKNTVLVMNTVNDETNVDLITEFKETPNALLSGKKQFGYNTERSEASQLFFVRLSNLL